MTVAVLDDHLLRDVLLEETPSSLDRALQGGEPATTNLFLYRLCRGAMAARGGTLTRGLPEEVRRGLARHLADLRADIRILPMSGLVSRMAELSVDHRVSTLGAEALAAAEVLHASICVWEGDDGPAMRAGAKSLGIGYRTVVR